MKDEGFNLTELIIAETRWRELIPDEAAAVETARGRGLIFDSGARRALESLARACGRRMPFGWDGGKGTLERFVEARGRACDAVRWLADGEGEAAKLAREAIARFQNCLEAEETVPEVRAAVKAANDAARAYFIGGGEARPIPHTATQLDRIDANAAIAAGKKAEASKRGRKYRDEQLRDTKAERTAKKRDLRHWLSKVDEKVKHGQSVRSAAKNVAKTKECRYKASTLARKYTDYKKGLL